MTAESSRQGVERAVREAFYVYVRGRHATARMIQCGTDALMLGIDDAPLVALAGADAGVEVAELLPTFRDAAGFLGVELPSESMQAVWTARHAGEFEASGVGGIEPRSNRLHFEENLLVVVKLLRPSWPGGRRLRSLASSSG